MSTFPPTIGYIGVPGELPKGFNINLPAPRLEAIRFFMRELIEELTSVTLDTRPVDENDERDAPDASKWTTLTQGETRVVDEDPVSIRLDARFTDCKASTEITLDLRAHRKELSKALDVVQIQQMTGMGGIWRVDIRPTTYLLSETNFDVEMRVVAECKEDSNGGKRMV